MPNPVWWRPNVKAGTSAYGDASAAGAGSGGGGGGHGGNTNMPNDPAGRLALQQAAAARNTYLSNLQQQQQGVYTNYGDQLHDINRQQPIDFRSLISGYGSRGMAFSSGYGDAYGDLSDQYTTQRSRLDEARAQALAQLRLNRQNYNNEYGLNLSAIRQAAADRLSANAGSLGLGKGTGNADRLAKLLQGNG